MTVFFCDRDLGRAFPERLRASGVAAERHDDHFDDDTADEDWIRQIGRRGWYALSHNERSRYTPIQRDTVMMEGVGLFILVGATTNRELADNFLRTLDVILRFIARTPVPFIAKVYRPAPADLARSQNAPGRIELWLSHGQWRRTAGRHR